jgi:hypothetical protein
MGHHDSDEMVDHMTSFRRVKEMCKDVVVCTTHEKTMGMNCVTDKKRCTNLRNMCSVKIVITIKITTQK